MWLLLLLVLSGPLLCAAAWAASTTLQDVRLRGNAGVSGSIPAAWTDGSGCPAACWRDSLRRLDLAFNNLTGPMAEGTVWLACRAIERQVRRVSVSHTASAALWQALIRVRFGRAAACRQHRPHADTAQRQCPAAAVWAYAPCKGDR